MRRSLWIDHRPGLVVACLAALLVVAGGCGSGGLSVQEYDQRLVEIFQPDEATAAEDPFVFDGLIPSLAKPFEIMRCLDRPENPCLIPPEFTELRGVAEQARFEVADYRGKLCQDEELTPPADLEDFHRSLCADLQTLMRALDTIHMTSQQALSALRDPDQSESFVKRAAERILDARADMIEVLEGLRSSSRLEPIFADAEEQIPELQN